MHDLAKKSYPDGKTNRGEVDKSVRIFQRQMLDNRGHEIFGRYQSKHSLARLYTKHNKIILGALDKIVPQGEPVLEIGCAFGNFLRDAVCQYDVIGLEYSFESVSIARKHLADNAKLVNGSGEFLPFRDGSFQAVVIKGVVAHFNNIVQAFTELSRVLKDGGWLVLMEGVSDANYRRVICNWADRLNVKHDHALFDHPSSEQLFDYIRQGGLVVRNEGWIPGFLDPACYLGLGSKNLWRLLDICEKAIDKGLLSRLFRYYKLMVCQKK